MLIPTRIQGEGSQVDIIKKVMKNAQDIWGEDDALTISISGTLGPG